MEKLILTNLSVDELAAKIVEKLTASGHEKASIQEMANTKEYLSIEEASELIGLAVTTIYGLTHRNTIPYIKKGKKLWFKRSELINWLDAGRRHTKEEIEKLASDHLKKYTPHQKFR